MRADRSDIRTELVALSGEAIPRFESLKVGWEILTQGINDPGYGAQAVGIGLAVTDQLLGGRGIAVEQTRKDRGASGVHIDAPFNIWARSGDRGEIGGD